MSTSSWLHVSMVLISSLCGDDRTLLPNVLIICLPATHSLSIRSAKRRNNPCFICRHTKKAFPVCRELSRRDNYSSYSCSSHSPGRFLQTIYLYRYTSQTRSILSTDCSCPFTYGMNVSSIYSWNIDTAMNE